VTGNSQSSGEGRALVTGCAGFLGSHLCERLLDDGHEVLGIDCFTDYYPREVKERNLAPLLGRERFALREVDLSEHPLDGLLDGVATVFHLAAQPGVRGSFGTQFELYVRHNVRGTQRLLEEAAIRPVERFVYASSSSVYGEAQTYPLREDAPPRPVSPYGMTKVATETLAGVYLRSAGVHTVGLRYFTLYGPRQRPDMALSRFLCQALAREPLIVFDDGLQVREFTYVTDAVDATVAAARRGRPGAIYNIGGGESMELLSVVHVMEELLECRLAVSHLPAQRGEARRATADVSRAIDELGFAPSTPFREGLAAQLEWTLDEARQARVAA
jgi:nucleoside-diphosphate-sugar epimerase